MRTSLAILIALLIPILAWADTSPPKLVGFVEATYPETAPKTGARVELVITVAADGSVADVEVAAGAGAGFDEAAVAAARRFTFEPAQNNGTPIAARIRYAYVFSPPAPPPPPPVVHGRIEGRVLDRARGEPVVGAEVRITDASGAIVATRSTGDDGRFALDELAAGTYHVRVDAFELATFTADEIVEDGVATAVTYRLDPVQTRSETQTFGATAVIEPPPREVTTRKLRGAELTQVAGTRGDALRVIELLPGVARPAAGQGVLMVRGSAPWDSGVLLDGADVLKLYHFGGLTSFVPSGLIQSIDFYPGNFSTRYGRRTGGVVEVTLREPRTDRVHALLDASMLDTAMQVEGPLARDVSFFAAARRSYMDAWFTSVVPADEIGVSQAPVYWDWQAMVQWKPTARDRIRLTGYGDDDRLAILVKNPDDHSPTMRGRVAGQAGSHRGALAWKHRYAEGVEHEISLATGPFYFNFDLGPALSQRIEATGVYGRAEWRADVASSVRVIGGLDVTDEFGRITFDGPRFAQVEGNPGIANHLDSNDRTHYDKELAFFRPAAYVETSVRPGRGLELIGGLRTDYFGELEQLTLDPRLVVRQRIDDVVIKAGVGRFSQAPDYGEAVEGLGNPDLDAISALHTDAGVEWKPRERASLGMDVFYKRLDNLVVGGEGMLRSGGEGRIYGLEASARLAPGGRFSGFASYTLSRSERNDDGMTWRLFDYDQTHILAAAGQLVLGRGWTLGSTLRITSGKPDTPIVDRIYDADRDIYRPVYGAVNSERNPLFHQLDLRVEKLWRRRWGTITGYLDVQNAYNARHVEGRSWNYDYTRSATAYGLPILPSLGLRGEL